MNTKEKLENYTEGRFNTDELIEICDEYALEFLRWYDMQPNKIKYLLTFTELLKLYKEHESNR